MKWLVPSASMPGVAMSFELDQQTTGTGQSSRSEIVWCRIRSELPEASLQ